MVCAKCGAEYDNTFDKCPYCGEIFKIPEGEGKNKKKKEYGKNVRKLARTLKIQEESAEKILKAVPYVVGVIAVLLCVFVAYKYFSGVGSKEHKTMTKNIKQMETYMKEGKYGEVAKKIAVIKEPLKYEEYFSYYSVAEIYKSGGAYIEAATQSKSAFSSGEHELIAENADKALESLTEVYFVYEALVAKYGSSDNVKKYSKDTLNWFIEDAVENYKLSEKEVYEVMREGYKDETVIESYTDVVFRRVRATGDAYLTDDIFSEE